MLICVGRNESIHRNALRDSEIFKIYIEFSEFTQFTSSKFAHPLSAIAFMGHFRDKIIVPQSYHDCMPFALLILLFSISTAKGPSMIVSLPLLLVVLFAHTLSSILFFVFLFFFFLHLASLPFYNSIDQISFSSNNFPIMTTLVDI